MSTPTAKAKLFRMTDGFSNLPPAGSDDLVEVQFNPTSLSCTAQNTLEKKGRDAKATQYVSQTTAKLELELVFDTTHDGSDVRKATDKIKRFLDPKSKDKQPAPPVIGFLWGSFTFKGFLESFKEAIDYFSAEGVPLRSSVKVSIASLSSQDAFLAQDLDGASAGIGGDVTLVAASDRGTSATSPGGGRALAAANGLDSMRNPGGGLLAVAGGGIELKAAASFSTGGSAGVGASFGFATSAGSRQVTAANGAFAGLGASRTPSVARVDLGALTSPRAATGASGNFAVGGQAIGSASVGLKADVGATARITFD